MTTTTATTTSQRGTVNARPQFDTVNYIVPFSELAFYGSQATALDFEVSGEAELTVQVDEDGGFWNVSGIGQLRISEMRSAKTGDRIPMVGKWGRAMTEKIRENLLKHVGIHVAASEFIEQHGGNCYDIADMW